MSSLSLISHFPFLLFIVDVYLLFIGPKGPLALYNGFGVSVLGIIPYRGVYFGMFDTLTALNPYQQGNSLISLLARFGCAQVTAITAGYASYPFDTVRRRLQMQSEKPREQWVYANTLDCFGKVYSKEGFRAFFKVFFHDIFFLSSWS